MNVRIKRIVERARILQENIDSRIDKIPVVSFSTYLKFCSIVFFVSGLGLFMYCFMSGVHPLSTQVLSSPFFYLIMGFVCILFHIMEIRK